MLLDFVKKVFKIEYIFIYIAVIIIFCTAYFKRVSNSLMQRLDSDMFLIQLSASSESKDVANEAQDIAGRLSEDYEPFTYFDEALRESLDAIIQNIQNGTPSPNETIAFQKRIHRIQSRLNLGYDSILYGSLVLVAIAAFVILEKYFKNSIQLEHLKTMQSEQSNLSRDLHDGVAQNLAALKIYLEKEDLPKSKFYAKQALNEIRYMIGSSAINYSEDFETMVRDICTAFEANFGITTKVYIASDRIFAMDKSTAQHLMRILQEALSNISRHSDATEVEVKIIDGIDDFRFIISDNGRDFDESLVGTKNRTDSVKHYGLGNIKKRAELIGASVDFIHKGGFTIALTVKNSVR